MTSVATNASDLRFEPEPTPIGVTARAAQSDRASATSRTDLPMRRRQTDLRDQDTRGTAAERIGADPTGADATGTELTGSDLIDALGRFRDAENAAKLRARTSLGIGENALLALRLMADAQHDGRQISPKELAERLGVTAATTSALVDRLVRAGHAERHPDSSDRRGVTLSTSGVAVRRALRVLRDAEERTRAAIDAADPETLRTVVAFLDDMARAVAADSAVNRTGVAMS